MFSDKDKSKVKILFDYLFDQLKEYYPEREVLSLLYTLFEEYFSLKRTDIAIYPDKELSSSGLEKILSAADDLINYKPIQYIIGKSHFYGLDFIVEPGVLIPRPETEELIRWIIDENKYDSSRILDIGSSSGCIAVCLNKFIEGSKVSGMDISETALSIAKKNNDIHQTDVSFFKFDIFDRDNWSRFGRFDIIVSNPPYVRESEKDFISRNVLDYEPEAALFVGDDDPLVFYKAILEFSKMHLKSGGGVYFEINEVFGKEMKHLMEEKGFSDIVIKEDINGKERMIRGRSCD